MPTENGANEPRELPESLFRCDCGTEILGVSFYTWRDDPPDWFIEVYKIPGQKTWRWRLAQIVNLLLGREVVVEAVSLDREKTDRLISFLVASVAYASREAVSYSSARPTITGEIGP